MMMTIIFWVVLVILSLHYFILFTNRNGRIIDKTFPHPFRLPIINNLYLAMGSLENLYIVFFETIKKYNHKTFTIWTHEKPFVCVADYKVAKMILSSSTQLNKVPDYKNFEAWLGQGIFTAQADRWKRNRKLLNPAFHIQILQKFFKIFDSNADVLCEKFENHLGKEAFDVYQYVTLYALDNICGTSMGINMNAQKNLESKYVKAVKKMSVIFFLRVYIPWLRPDWLFKYTSTGRLQQKLLSIIHGHNEEIIRKRKREFEVNGNNNASGPEENFKEKTAFLDLLLEIGKDGKLRDEEIRDEVATVMYGGHDTVASAISFLLYTIAEHQDVQEKVYEEIEHIFGSSQRCPTYDDVQEMKYTEQVIKETLRFYTVLPAIGRHLTEDLRIGDGRYIPKGTEVLIGLAGIHRDPELWPNPEVFDPDRFSPEGSKDRHPFAFVPFCAGSRNCIGQKFAMHQMKITAYKVLRRFKLLPSEKPEDKVRVKLGVILTSVNGMKLRVQPREREIYTKSN